MITGPYKINGVPLRRISQCYLMSTQTKIQLNPNWATEINDEYFKKKKVIKKKN